MAQITTIDQLRQLLDEPNRLTRAKVRDELDEQATEFVRRSPFLLLATTSSDGRVEVSPKGDAPGFVEVLDERTIAIPDRPGNNLAFGLTNILANPNVGLILLAPGTGETLRISGRATLHDDADLCEKMAARGRPAIMVIRVAIAHAYFHCARSVLRAGLWDQASWPAPMRISFGRIIADATRSGSDLAAQIDSFVDAGYHAEL